MDNIRLMRREDIPRVAYLHHQAMGNSLWATFGLPFLEQIYTGLLETPEFIGFVYIENTEIHGFIAGSTHSKNMMQRVFRAHYLRLGICAMRSLVKPSVLKHIVSTASYFQRSTMQDTEVFSESLFCSFSPHVRGKRISGHINKVLFDTFYAIGIEEIKVTTETDNIGANRQLQSWGFVAKGTFHFYGKEMVTYILHFPSSDRVEKQDWRLSLS